MRAFNIKSYLMLLPVLFIAAQMVGQGPCLDGWKYRMSIIVNNAGPTLAAQQLKFVTNTQDLVLAGKAKADASDLRVTDAEGNPLNFWIKNLSYNTPSTTIWLKANEVKGNGKDTLYLFYGNPSANSVQSGTGTFEFFDDFKGTVLNNDKWRRCFPGGFIDIGSGSMKLKSLDMQNKAAALYSKVMFTVPVWLDVSINSVETGKTLVSLVDDDANGWGMVYEQPGTSLANMRLNAVSPSTTSGECILLANQSPVNDVQAGATSGVWSFAWPESSVTKMLWPGGNESRTDASQSAFFANPKKIYLANTTHASTTEIDYVAVRKYVLNQPTLSLGLESQLIADGFGAFNGGPYCQGQSINLTAPVIADATYEWTGPGIEFGTAFGREISIFDAQENKAGPYILKVAITGGCPSQTVSTNVEVFSKSDAGVISSSKTVCGGNNQGVVKISGDIGSVSAWQSASDTSGPWNNLGSTTDQISYTNLTQSIHYRAIVKSGICEADTSQISSITVSPATQAGYINGAVPACAGLASGELTLVGYVGQIDSWEFSENNGITWNTILNTTNKHGYTELTKTTKYRAKVKSGFCEMKNSDETTVVVHPKPSVQFGVNNVCIGNPTSFVNQSSTDPSNIYRWDFGDGGESALKSPSHNYALANSYQVKLAVINGKSCIDSISKIVTVNPKPEAKFDFSSICEGTPSTFIDRSTIATGQIANFDWTLGETGETESRPQFQFSFNETGDYNVKLKVTSVAGCKDSISKLVPVYFSPKASFSAENGCVGSSIKFTNTSQEESGTTHQWFFDDFSSSTEKSPSHVFNSEGEYNVSLQIRTANGCVGDTIIKVTVYPNPVVLFAVNDGCLYDSIEFINQSSVDANTTFIWGFGDGNNATGLNQKHKYTNGGTYVTSLLATSEQGCDARFTKTVEVFTTPKADFAVAAVCLSDSAKFINLSSDPINTIVSNTWLFGDGSSRVLNNPAQLYSKEGIYSVILVSKNDKNCVDSSFADLTIHPLPKSSFLADPVCNGKASSFINQSSISSGAIKEYTWRFGDGSVATEQNPIYNYLESGNYQVNLTAVSNLGCIKDTSIVHLVYPTPTANFTVKDACLNKAVSTLNSSVISDASPLTYKWTFDDSTGISSKNPSYTFSNPGLYSVKLVTSSGFACKDSVEALAMVFPINQVNATRDTTVSFGYGANLGVSAINPASYLWSPSAGLDDRTINNPKASPDKTTTYQVAVTDINGCVSTDEVEVTVIRDHKIEVQNLITPDGNGKNDTWKIVNADNYSGTMDISVFDRNGKEVYQENGYNPNWGGVRGTDQLPDGTYYYIISFRDSKETYKGALTILRN